MCGICGFYGKKDKGLLQEMTKALEHRGPDDEGFYEDELVSLGHRRLSIIDLSQTARQPMQNEDASIQLVFNGEIYNFKELRADLEKKGHRFISRTDSEVIIHLYEEYGEVFLNYLNGMFAFGLWDKRDNKLLLARDRIGIKPLYYSMTKARLLFASEIKAILKDSDISKAVNATGFDYFMSFQCIPDNFTMFKNIDKVPAGHMLIFKGSQIDIRRYWQLEKQETDFSNHSVHIKDLLAEAVKQQLISDVPLGVLLSGGLDSSILVALAAQLKKEPLKTFTVGFGEKDDELPYGRLVSRKFNTKHHEFIARPKSLENLFAKIAWHMDEPLADGGAIATYLVSELVKSQVKVILVGEGSDEIFGGYSWHRLAKFPFKLLPYPVKRKLYFYLTTFYKDKALKRSFYPVFDHKTDKNFNLFRKMSDFELERILPNSLLMKVDKMTMAHSIEARVPFLDHRIVEYMYNLSFALGPQRIVGKKLLKEIFKDILPQAVLKRRKHGFIVPLERWLLGAIKNFAQEALLHSKSYFPREIPKKEIEKLFIPAKCPLKSIENTAKLWRLFIFQLWAERYL